MFTRWVKIILDTLTHWVMIHPRSDVDRVTRKGKTMKTHELKYLDLHPQPLEKPKADWPWAIATLAIFALIGVLLAWRG